MATIDQQFVEYIVKTLVNNPDKVEIERTIDEKGVLLKLSVAPEDVGRVIGRRGATAQSLRTLLRALGTKNDARYNLKIVNTDGPVADAPEPAPVADVDIDDDEEEDDGEDKFKDINLDSVPMTAEEEDDIFGSNLAERTRAELDDLDDLDI